MSDSRRHAHPMIEPLNFDLTPEAAKQVLDGSALAVYGLLWRAALATAAEGPAIRTELLRLALTAEGGHAPGAIFQVVSEVLVEPGWLAILPGERQRVSDPCAAPMPATVGNVLNSLPAFLGSDGKRYRAQEQCNVLLGKLGPLPSWRVLVAARPCPVFGMDGLLEQMSERGVGRPSTFADRIEQARTNRVIDVEDGRLVVGDYGKLLLDALAALPRDEVVDAGFCSELEAGLAEIEINPSAAGDLLTEFCKRSLGAETELADWLDALEIDGESMEETLRRVGRTLPPADSWDVAGVPRGLDPFNVMSDPGTAAHLRKSFDACLAQSNLPAWKGLPKRGRAARRLAALALAEGDELIEPRLQAANRDIAVRWWIDLGPQEAPLLPDELLAIYPEVRAIHAQFGAELGRLAQEVKRCI